MKYIFFLCVAILCSLATIAQHDLRLVIKESEGKKPLVGATVRIAAVNRTQATDSLGQVVFTNLPAGDHNLIISYVGLEEQVVSIRLPQSSTEPFEVLMAEEEHEHEEEVIVTATRISRSISNTPTRTEVISGEELTEKANMKPGEIRMLLSESTGIQTQQTSATSYNYSIRIQGLDGRYTQILRDGYPLYSGFSGGLSIMQVTPLDLRQVEVIKGSASTLYGGGAIAGLVNLVSKTPSKERELSFIANATSAGGLDLSSFYSQRYKSSGLTVFASRNSSAAYDPADIGLTAIPKFTRYTINPRLFLYGKKTTADVGVSFITEDRIGGNINYIKNGGSGYFEENNTDRITTQAGIAHRINDRTTIQLKNSYSHFKRAIIIPTYTFDAVQQSSFTEFSLNSVKENLEWVFGGNLITDDLVEEPNGIDIPRDYHYNTVGLFLQNAWSPSERFTLESGLRGDFVNQFGFELLPRVSALYKFNSKFSSRIGGGFGYKSPTVFTEESETIQFRNILPIDPDLTKNERSVGGNWDINFRTTIGSVGLTINNMFFYTRLNRPLILVDNGAGKSEFRNADGHIDTKGMETNLRLLFGDFKLFLGYTYTDANTHYTDEKNWLPLTARHRLNNVLMYEIEEKLKLGLEAYYFSEQRLNDGAIGKSYWIAGFMAEKIWNKFSVYINFENFTDTRQTKFDTIYTGSIDDPQFRDIYAPVEGFVVNGGVKFRF